MLHWSWAMGAALVGFTLGSFGTALFVGAKVNRVLGAARRALGYLNNNAPREAWKVLNQLMNEEDVP